MNLPTAPDAERSLLGALLVDGSLLSRVTAILKPEDIASDAHRLVYEACLALAGQGEGVDLVTVQSELERTGKLERAGGPAALSALVDRVPDVENVKTYAGIVKDAAERWRLLLDLRRRVAAVEKGEPDAALVHHEKKSGGVFDIVGVLGRSSTSGPRFLTGIVALDERLSPRQDLSKHGLPFGRIVGLVGPPHAGKSLLADQIALSAARVGFRVVLLSTDEPREDAAERIGQGLGFRHAELNADYPETLARLREAEGVSNIAILPDEEAGPMTIEEAGEILFSVEAPGHVLVLDSLHKVRSSAESDDDSPRVAIEKRLNACRALRDRGALVIFTSEANRSFYASSDPAQRSGAMASGAESRSIEFTADVLLTLRREGDDFRCEVPKNRIGRQYAPFTLRLHEGSASFRSISEEAATMEKAGRRAEGFLSLEDKIVELLRGAPEGLSQRGIEAEKLGRRDDVRDALRSTVAKGKTHPVPFPRGAGFLYRLGAGAPGAPEVRERCASAPAEMLDRGARATLRGRAPASLDGQMGFQESTAHRAPPVSETDTVSVITTPSQPVPRQRQAVEVPEVPSVPAPPPLVFTKLAPEGDYFRPSPQPAAVAAPLTLNERFAAGEFDDLLTGGPS